jgi:two-component system OmpR family response regulator
MPTYADSHGARATGWTADAQPDRTAMRILVIEDDHDAADYLVKAFREVGHVADAATDGEDGLAMALDGQYDVLIVDRMLPKRDGLSIIGTLREKGIETPALILSALGQVDDRVKGLRAGGDDYLPKISLQPREFRLLEYLMQHAGQVVTRTMLLENVWDYHFDPQTNVIDVHISRLRSKIDKGFSQPLLHTVRGAGYMIRDGAR